MKKLAFVYSDGYLMDLKGHIFPVQKYRIIKERLLKMGFTEEDFFKPEPASWEELALVHTKDYLEDLKNLRWTWRTERSEMPLTEEIVNGFRLMAGGTFLALKLAWERKGIGFHIGGGFHHAYPDHAEGFCYINDLAFAIRKSQRLGLIKKALVVDCDLHQGNGTAYIFRNDSDVFTFSIHQEDLYPYPKEKSDWDIGLPSFTEDGVYLYELETALKKIYESFEPEVVVYQAGADPYKEDQLGNLMISMEGLQKRDRLVIGMARERGLPVVVTLGGGYAKRLEDTIEIHLNTARIAMEFSEYGEQNS